MRWSNDGPEFRQDPYRQQNEAPRPALRGNMLAIKRGLAALSTERVEDTLLAEAGDYAGLIERFRDGRAEHNDDSLASSSRRARLTRFPCSTAAG